jgi:nucleoporin SEH1
MDNNADNNIKTRDFADTNHQPQNDTVQERLDHVTRRLARPLFLKDISCSRLPSQAASTSSLSPGEAPQHFQQIALQARRKAFGYGNLGTGDLRQQSPLQNAVDYGNIDDFDEVHLTLGHTHETAAAVLEHNSKSGSETFKGIEKKLEELQSSFLRAWKSVQELQLNIKMASERGFSTFEHGHSDLVLAVDFNFYGTRMVTASSDHTLKVYDRKDESWSLIDTWRAHDAEIVDVKWNGPFTGSIIGSIGEDGRFNLWEEDLLEPPHSHRRFRRIQSIRSETRVPFCSLDFKNLHTETYVALVTRDGFLSISEPVDHDNLSGDWSLMTSQHVCATPSRQDETGFRVAWHKEKIPCWSAIEAGLDRKALSLAVAAMEKVLIYRTDKERKWYLATHLPPAGGVIRDVAWANGAMRGYDVIATASKDGAVRIYEITTPNDPLSKHGDEPSEPGTPPSQVVKARTTVPSGLAAGLASTPSSSKDGYKDSDRLIPGRVRQEAKEVAKLTAHNGSVWRVTFSQLGKFYACRQHEITAHMSLGDLLVSSGDDGSVRTWKKALSGNWLEYSQIDLASEA